MAGYARFVIGSGIASVQYAYVSAGGVRMPSSDADDYFTATSSSNAIYCDHLFIASVTYKSGYGAPWSASYNSATHFAAGSARPSSGSGNVLANLYPSTSTSAGDAARITLTGTAAASYTVRARTDGYEVCFSSVTPNGTASYGETVSFRAVMEDGYSFDGWYTSGGSKVSAANPYSYYVTAGKTLYARATVEWDNSHAAGTNAITAEEWNRVIDFVACRNGVSAQPRAAQGDLLTAAMYNALRNAIGSGSTVSKGQAITRSLLDELVENANSL